jgi:ferredoxin
MGDGMSDDAQPLVTFDISGIQLRWDAAIDNLLEFAEEQGLMPDFGCRAGSCETCKVRLLSGEVHYVTEPVVRPDKGEVLLCSSIPTSDVVIEL